MDTGTEYDILDDGSLGLLAGQPAPWYEIIFAFDLDGVCPSASRLVVRSAGSAGMRRVAGMNMRQAKFAVLIRGR